MNLLLSCIVSFIMILISLKNRAFGILMVLLLLPTYLIRFSVFDIPMTLLEMMILALFVTFLIQEGKALWKYVILPQWYHYCIVLFIIAGIVSLFITPQLRAGAGFWKAYIIEPILFFIVFIHTMKTERDIYRIIAVLGISASIIGIIAVIQYYTGWNIPDAWYALPNRRATGIYGYPNAVGLYLAPITVLLWSILVLRKTVISRIWYLLGSMGVVICIAGLASARVDGAIIGALAGMGVVLLCTRWRFIMIACFVLGLIVALWYEPTRQVLLFQDVSGDVRVALWKGTLNLLYHQPLFGAGLGGFPEMYNIYRLPSHIELLLYPHNIFLDFWVELGLIGLFWIVAVLIFFFFHSVRAAIKEKQWLGVSLTAVMTCVVVYGFVDVPYFKNDLAVLFWTLLGLLYMLIHKKSQNTDIR